MTSLRCWTSLGVDVDRLKGELFMIIAALGVEVVIPLETTGRACRAITPDRSVVRDEEATSGRSIAGDGLDIVDNIDWREWQ